MATKQRRRSVLNARDRAARQNLDDYDTAQQSDDDPDSMDRPDLRLQPFALKNLSKLKKEAKIDRSLTSSDPNVSDSHVRFEYVPYDGDQKVNYPEEKKGIDWREVLKKVDAVDGVKVHFTMKGRLVAEDDPAAVKQQEYQDMIKKFEEKNKMREIKRKMEKQGMVLKDVPMPGEEVQEEPLYDESYQLKNQFNFTHRATQTFNNEMRPRELKTLPPPLHDLTYDVTGWDIFDSFLQNVKEAKKRKEEREKAKSSFGETKVEEEEEVVEAEEQKGVFFSEEFLWASTLMERMVTLNSESESFVQFQSTSPGPENSPETKYFKDLWKLRYDEATSTVTAMCWNPEFTDLLAVGYGSYDFATANLKTSKGLICCFSLKNTSFPEYVFHTESGVMCLDFHPEHPSLLCCGLYDGTVVVFDVRSGSEQPIFISLDPRTQHTDPVWEVRWQKGSAVLPGQDAKDPSKEEAGQQINFFSISSDGRVTKWLMNKNELVSEEVVELKLSARGDSSEEESDLEDDTIVGLAGGSCFDFNETSPHLFIVGTEEGGLYSYSKAYNSQALKSYDGHHMAVYRVLWNPFHPSIYLSCSADWTVKLWEYNNFDPVMTFDLQCAVSDIAWAPYKSTIFAVATVDGTVRVFDLAVDKHRAVGVKSFRDKRNRLTHLSFNPDMPILALGFSDGSVYTVKLTGPLMSEAEKIPSRLGLEEREEEVLSLDKLLIIDDKEGTVEGVKIKKDRAARKLQKEKEEAAAKLSSGD